MEARRLIDCSIEEARRIKWERGSTEHGPIMEEDPLEALYAEFADAINYTFAAADPNRLGGRQIEALGHIRNGLRAWAYAVELIYATAPVYVPTEAKFHKE